MSEQQEQQEQESPTAVAEAAAAAKAEEERVAEQLRTAEEHEATRSELEALRKEKEAWAAERAELETKAARVVPAPVKKAEKLKAKEEAPAAPRKARVSARWFGEAAYVD